MLTLLVLYDAPNRQVSNECRETSERVLELMLCLDKGSSLDQSALPLRGSKGAAYDARGVRAIGLARSGGPAAVGKTG